MDIENFSNVFKPINEHLNKINIKSSHREQEIAAYEIVQYFLNGVRYVNLNAKCQSGKTGVGDNVINILSYHKLYKDKLGINHIYCITGDNGVTIKEQTIKSHLVHSFNMNFFFGGEGYVGNTISFLKNSDMKKIIQGKKQVPSEKNNLFIIDESHYATKKKTNIVNKFLKHLGVNYMKNDNSMNDSNSYILSVSATPWKEMSNDMGNTKQVVSLLTGEGYVGFEEFDENGQIDILYNKDILKNGSKCYKFFAEELYNYLVDFKKKTNRKPYCIVRNLGNSNIELNRDNTGNKYHIVEVIQKGNKNIDFSEMEKKIESICINQTEESNKFLLIVIKGAYKHGAVIQPVYKDYCGASIDYCDAKDNVEATEQGLLGRFSGYTNERIKDAWKYTKFYMSKLHYDMIKEHSIRSSEYNKSTPYGGYIERKLWGMGNTFDVNENGFSINDTVFEDVTKYFDNRIDVKNKIKDISKDNKFGHGELRKLSLDVIKNSPNVDSKYLDYTIVGARRTYNRKDGWFETNSKEMGKTKKWFETDYGKKVIKCGFLIDLDNDKIYFQIKESFIDRCDVENIYINKIKEIETYKTDETPKFDFTLPQIKNNVELAS